ncbi:hypothetical protein CRUP_000437 [Coryphaenoides rupestris]|nr:hypothetical protein CRUP_000437 [Coryphaenoides rupestris]
MTLLDVWLSRSLPMWLLLQSLVLMALCFPSASMCPKGCVCQRFDLHHLHVHHQGLNVNCSHSRLKEIPGDLPVDTVVLRLDRNQITAVPDRVFRGLGLLRDLNLSYNAVETLGRGPPLAAWRPRCSRPSAAWPTTTRRQPACCAAAQSSATRRGGPSWPWTTDLCNLAKRTTDYAMLVTMFGWFAMVISYVVYYVRQNQEDARRHLEVPEVPAQQAQEAGRGDDISTVV